MTNLQGKGWEGSSDDLKRTEKKEGACNIPIPQKGRKLKTSVKRVRYGKRIPLRLLIKKAKVP